MLDKNDWYAMKAYSFLSPTERDILDFFIEKDGIFIGSFHELTIAIDCEYVNEPDVIKSMTSGMFSDLFVNDGIKGHYLKYGLKDRLVIIAKSILGDLE